MNLGQKAINIKENQITISSSNIKNKVPIEIHHTFLLKTDWSLVIFEDDEKVIEYKLEAISANPNLDGQYLHTSIRILENYALMVDGIINKERNYENNNFNEGVRFQPCFLSLSKIKNEDLIGKGLFERGLHFNGTVTPKSVRVVCVCDFCKHSFSLEHFHAGFANSQYFYSGDGKQTLIVRMSQFPYVPAPLEKKIDITLLDQLEEKLPLPTEGKGRYKYYNSLRCPNCLEPFIDFEKYPEIRPFEYYGNVFINKDPQFVE